MTHLDARTISLALVRLAKSRTGSRKRPRRGPDSAGDGVAVNSPRTPTLSGGAAATIDA